jgi:DNA polymerase-3 subunit delta'
LTKLDRGAILDRPEIVGLAQGSPGAAIHLWEQLQTIPPAILDRGTKLPTTLREALELASQIDRELEPTEQLWLLDYLQYIYWQEYRDSQLIQTLEQARQHLSAYVQPRLVWECVLVEIFEYYARSSMYSKRPSMI